MDVRCERCRAQYVFDDDQVTPAGLTVQCTNCGHVFRVKKKELVVTVPVKPGEYDGLPIPATAAAPRSAAAAAAAPAREPEAQREPVREWRVRQPNGNIFTFRELTTLQKWIIEQKVSRDDEISHSGEQWKRLGNIADLASFFQVVEAAERGRTQGAMPSVTPLPTPALAMPSQAAPAAHAPPPQPAPSVDADLGPEEVAAVKRGRGGRLALAALLVLAAGGAGAYAFAPQLFARTAKQPDAIAVPITIEVKPQQPAPPAEPPPAPMPAPVPAPEPVVERAVEPPPEPIAKPPASPPPAPKGPKAILAQAERLRERGKVEEALDLYGRVADDDPENVAALTGRALCYLDLEKYPPAEASFEAALRIDPKEPDALLGLAETYRWQGKKADAIRYYERYLVAHPGGEEVEVARNALLELRK